MYSTKLHAISTNYCSVPFVLKFLKSVFALTHTMCFSPHTHNRYKITDHFHGTQAIICTRCFVPGPAGLWKRSKFLEIFGLHPSLPFGEDIFGGFTTLNSGTCCTLS